MELEFKAQLEELQNAVDQILANRDRRTIRRDLAYLLVSEIAATLRTTGTSVELPVVGTSCGAAAVPLAVLENIAKIAGTFAGQDLRVKVTAGTVRIGSWKTTHSGIKLVKLEELPDSTIDLAVDASSLETLGLASLLTLDKIVAQGLKKRVDHARRQAKGAISSAASTLAEFNVSAAQIEALVQASIKEAGIRIASSLQKSELVKKPESPKRKARAANQSGLFD